MFNVRLAGGHLYGKQLFTWLSLVVSLMASFVLSFFPLDVLDEIWDLIESVSEGFLTYSSAIRKIDYNKSIPDHFFSTEELVILLKGHKGPQLQVPRPNSSRMCGHSLGPTKQDQYQQG